MFIIIHLKSLKNTLRIRIIPCIILMYHVFSPALYSENSDYVQDIKAVFLYNFTKYIQWDEQTELSTFDIAVFGDSPIIEPLQQIAAKKTVNKKRIQIKSIQNMDQIEDCRLLFIPETEQTRLDDIVKNIGNKTILTVSEINNSLSSGVMINFLVSNETIKFEINLMAMKQAGIHPDSEMLKLAVRIIE